MAAVKVAMRNTVGDQKTKFTSVEEELAYVKAERDYLKKLYRSRFGHEWGAHTKEFCSK
jgi:hypothetical protein